jgi:hypothetical protein
LLLDRYNLCALNLGTAGSKQDYAWFDFMLCTYRNQAATTPKVPDDGKNAQRFSATVDYCAAVAGVPAGPLRSCAQDKALSTQLLRASHATDLASNTNVDAGTTTPRGCKSRARRTPTRQTGSGRFAQRCLWHPSLLSAPRHKP